MRDRKRRRLHEDAEQEVLAPLRFPRVACLSAPGCLVFGSDNGDGGRVGSFVGSEEGVRGHRLVQLYEFKIISHTIEAKKRRSFPRTTSFVLSLGYPDSNQERQDQNLQCYHYTIAQSTLFCAPRFRFAGAKVGSFCETCKLFPKKNKFSPYFFSSSRNSLYLCGPKQVFL